MAILAKIHLDERPVGNAPNRYADVYIDLFDEATNTPTNGNNVVVTYRLTETYDNSDHHTILTATVPGQSLLIDVGVPTVVGNYDEYGNLIISYSRVYLVIDISNVPNPAPPVTTCNLQITSISVDKYASAPGAADAQITVNAYSSYLPMMYSLDNITFQPSNIFTAVHGGLQTVYVTDANPLGCAANKSVAIPTLNSLLVKDPSVTMGENTSRWNAAFNPVVFTYQRKDFEIYNVSYDSLTGFASLLLNLSDTSKLKSDDKVYIDAAPYNGVFDVIRAEGSNLVIKTPYSTNATGFVNINKIRSYYAVKTRVTYFDKVVGRQQTIESINRPDRSGTVKTNIANFLQSLLNTKDESDFTKPNFHDSNLCVNYQIAYAQQYEENGNMVNTLYTEIPGDYFVVYAAKQLGERYGGNLAEYVPFKNVINGMPLARWVTDFKIPAYSNAYPFDIGFIYSEDLSGLEIYCELTLLDVNRTAVPGGTMAVALLNEDGSWLLNEDGSKRIIAGQTISNNTLTEQVGLNRLLVNTIFPPDAHYFTLTIKYKDEHDVSHAVTQTQVVRIDDAIDYNSVYLRWIGLSGSWNYYRFVYNQELTLDVQNAIIIKNHISDWEHQDSIEEVISKSAGQKMKVMAEDLSVNDIKGLQSIKYSPKVQMLVNKNPVKWQTVVLNTATFAEYETRNGQAPFSITFNLPSINIQSQ